MWFVTRKKIAGDQLKWQLAGFDLKKLALQINLINPTNTPINFSAYVAELFVNNKSAGILDYRNATTLPGGGSQIISIPIRINPLATITMIPLLRSGALKNAKLRLAGTLTAEGIAIPFDQPVSLG